MRNFFFLKNTFKVALQYLFDVFIMFNTNFKLNFKLKIDPNMLTCKNQEENLEHFLKKRVATLL